jgi:hypothetical protein
MGARSAGNPHAACDVEGTGNVVRSSDLPARQSSTLLIGGIEETSASFEARSAPRSYPTISEIGYTAVAQFATLIEAIFRLPTR